MNFNINNAMNTFNQQLGARVASGQMTADQARAAQAEMTALQRMPNATREQATDVAQRQMQVGQYAPTPVTPPMPQGGLTLVNVPQRLTLGNTPMPVEDIIVQPQRIMPAPLPSTPPAPMPKMVQPSMPQADTGFNINNAMNTFNQSLGERVASGQMTLDQARAAQAEMTALQRTANPTREQATNVAQSQLQVGPYAPQSGMSLGSSLSPQQQGVTKSPFIDQKGNTHFPDGSVRADGPGTVPPWAIPPLPPSVKGPAPFRAPPTDMREVIGARMPPPGVRGGDTRIFADQPMALPGGTGYDERGNMLRSTQPSLSNILRRGLMMPAKPVARPYVFDAGIGNGTMPQMPEAPRYTPPPPLPEKVQYAPTGRVFNNLMNKYRGRAY